MCSGTFVPNDIYSDSETGKIKVLTGPNACGKSVYLKQVVSFITYTSYLYSTLIESVSCGNEFLLG